MLLIPPAYLQIDRFDSDTVVLAAEIPVTLLLELQRDGVVLRDHVQIAECEAALFRNRLKRELLETDDLSGLIFEAIFTDLLVHANRKSCRKERVPASWLLQVRDLLHDRTLKHLRLREIAREVNVSPAQLSRDFRRLFGTSPGEYLRRLRVECAARLIEDSTKSLAEIAAVSGFADQAHLSRVFKQHRGLSPSEYRASA